MATPAAHPMGSRRKTRRHAGNEDVTGLMLSVALAALILLNLALLPFFPWGFLGAAICTAVFLVFLGRRMTHHTGDRWRTISVPSEPKEPVEDVLEPTMVVPGHQEPQEDRPAPNRHRTPTLGQKVLWGAVAVVTLLWLRNTRDRIDMEEFGEEGGVPFPHMPGAGLGSPGVRL